MKEKLALEKTIRHWEWIVGNNLTFESKGDFPEMIADGGCLNKCYLCEYVGQTKVYENIKCGKCPYNKAHPELRNEDSKYACEHNCSPYNRWHAVYNSQERLKYAKLFLEQLRELCTTG